MLKLATLIPSRPGPFVCSSCAKALRRQLRTFATAVSQDASIYDVVCVGGGPAGLSLLAALRASPVTSSLKVALIESQDLSAASRWSLPAESFSNRASSLTPSSKTFLEFIGAWKHFDHSRVQPYHRMQVWDGVSGSRIEFDWDQHGKRQDTTIAYMNENSNLVRGLLSQLSDLGGVSMFSKTSVSSISLGPSVASSAPDSLDLSSWPHVTLSNNQTLVARLLIGADGLNSPVRTFAGIPSKGWDYNRHGVVATIKMDSKNYSIDARRTAYQRFLPTGPIALLPLPGPYATLVWSTLPSHAAHLKTLSTTDFLASVNAAFRLSPVDINYLSTIPSGQASELAWRIQHTAIPEEGIHIPHMVVSVQEGSIASFPLRMRHADSYTASRVALVGDAAHTTHPLAGQGLNMGIGDVEALARNIAFGVQHGQDIGAQLSLEGYDAERYDTNHRLLGVVDKLHKIYSYSSGPVVGLRSWGLDAVNSFAATKEFFMRQAAGSAA